MKETRKLALGGMMAALSIVILMVGASIGIGTYAAPMLAAPLLSPVGRAMGKKYHVLLWIAVSLLSFLLVADVEQNLMYLCLFGLYPIIRPWFHRQKKSLQIPLKLLYFNAVVVSMEALLMLVLVPEVFGLWANLLLLLMGNAVFFCYDRLIPRIEHTLERRLGRLFSIN